MLYLGYFWSIQTLQHEVAPRSYDELVEEVQNSFVNLKREKLGNKFLSLQSCMTAALIDDGGNVYKPPHSKKVTLCRHGYLHRSLSCPPRLYDMARFLVTKSK